MTKLQTAIDNASFDQLPIEQVFWIDSFSHNGWTAKDFIPDLMNESMLCRSVGYLMEEDDLIISLAQNEAAEIFSEMIRIPKVAIISRRVLANGKEALNAGYGHARKI